MRTEGKAHHGCTLSVRELADNLEAAGLFRVPDPWQDPRVQARRITLEDQLIMQPCPTCRRRTRELVVFEYHAEAVLRYYAHCRKCGDTVAI